MKNKTESKFKEVQNELKNALKQHSGPLLFPDTRVGMSAVVYHQILLKGKQVYMLVDRLDENVFNQDGWKLIEVLRKQLNQGLHVTMVVRNTETSHKDVLSEVLELSNTLKDKFKLYKASPELQKATLTNDGGYFVFTVADNENYRQEHYKDSKSIDPEEVYNGFRDPEHAKKLSVFFNTMIKGCEPWNV